MTTTQRKYLKNKMMELNVPYIDMSLTAPRLRHRVTYVNIDQLITVVHAPPKQEWLAFGVMKACILNFSDGSSIHLDMSAAQFLDILNGTQVHGEEE